MSLERLVVVAAAIALGGGDVAILGVVVLDRHRRYLLRFAVLLVGKLAFLSASAHDIPLIRTDRRLARFDQAVLISLSAAPAGILERFPVKWIPVRAKKTRQDKLERFPVKWIPVRVKKTRQDKCLEREGWRLVL